MLVLLLHPPCWDLPCGCIACLRIRVYLLLAGVPHSCHICPRRPDTEELPALEDGGRIATPATKGGLEGFLLETQGIGLDEALLPQEKTQAKAYLSLLEGALQQLTEYLLWGEPVNSVSAMELFGQYLAWPLSVVLFRQEQKRRRKMRHLSTDSPEKLYDRAEEVLAFMSMLLSDGRTFVFEERASTVDALLYSYLLFHLRAPLVNDKLRQLIQKHPMLINYVDSISGKLPHLSMSGTEDLPPLQPPPFTRVPRPHAGASSSSSAAPSTARSGAVRNKEIAERRRSYLFIGAQFASILLYLFFASVPIELGDDGEDDEGGEDED